MPQMADLHPNSGAEGLPAPVCGSGVRAYLSAFHCPDVEAHRRADGRDWHHGGEPDSLDHSAKCLNRLPARGC